MGTKLSSVCIASISQGRIFLLNLMVVPSLCWILAYAVRGGGWSPRHKPARNVCPTFEVTLKYRALHRLAVLTDLDFDFLKLDPSLFPEVPSDVKVHSGFEVEHKKTASQILTEVERLMDEYSSTNVVLVRLHYCKLFPVLTFFGVMPADRSLAWRSHRGTRYAVYDA